MGLKNICLGKELDNSRDILNFLPIFYQSCRCVGIVFGRDFLHWTKSKTFKLSFNSEFKIIYIANLFMQSYLAFLDKSL